MSNLEVSTLQTLQFMDLYMNINEHLSELQESLVHNPFVPNLLRHQQGNDPGPPRTRFVRQDEGVL